MAQISISLDIIEANWNRAEATFLLCQKVKGYGYDFVVNIMHYATCRGDDADPRFNTVRVVASGVPHMREQLIPY